ncbi:MAG TPA: type VI secretion system lipoprotein TssJ, partial [Alphaproteobacteria bacterium]|nr:type VI secretion system lipoprotein TssJ [Alphaproteobacteria bacterium]
LGAVALTLKPGEEITRDYKFSSQTKFLGILVGYRDIANAKWREVVAVESEDSNDVVVTVDALSVSVAVDDSWF